MASTTAEPQDCVSRSDILLKSDNLSFFFFTFMTRLVHVVKCNVVPLPKTFNAIKKIYF